MRTTLVRALAAVALTVLPVQATPRVLHAPSPAPTPLEARCARTMTGTAVVLDCKPGFATAHDRIVVYPRDGADARSDPGSKLDSDAVWLVEPGAGSRVALLIDFHHDPNGRPVADLYDDGDGDASVGWVLADGVPRAVEHDGRPTVSVTSADSSWFVDGRPSFNLDISVDGAVRASFWSATFLDLLATDGTTDFSIHVRDLDGDGRPDLDWRQFTPPLPEDPRSSGYVRSEIVQDPADEEAPITGSLFWPYLAQTPRTGPADYAKPYGSSPPPIDVDWATGKIRLVSEFVASRGSGENSFIYSVQRVVEGATNSTDFDSPTAFYDLAGVDDGYPDTSIRFETTLPDAILAPRRNSQRINELSYSWGRRHDHLWTYALNLVGHQAVDETIAFPTFSVRAIPPADLPDWVADETWDAATFVEATQPYASTDGISEYGVDRDDDALARGYLSGISSGPPVAAYSIIPPGFRGEYAFDLRGSQARLYLSPIDLRLHLAGADGGIWNLGEGREIHYERLSGPAIDHWSLLQNGNGVADLYAVSDQLIYASSTGVLIGTDSAAGNPAELFAAPRDHATWTQLGALLDKQAPAFADDDLGAMFSRVAKSIRRLPGAAVSDLQPTVDGFRFQLQLTAPIPRVDWTAGAKPGTYSVTYRVGSGYRLAAAGSPGIIVAAPHVDAPIGGAAGPVDLSATVHNVGNVAATGVRVTFLAGRDRTDLAPVGTTYLDVPALGSGRVEVTWNPPAGGDWFVQATAGSPGSGFGPTVSTTLASAVDVSPRAAVTAQGVPIGQLAVAVGCLLAGVMLTLLLAGRRLGT